MATFSQGDVVRVPFPYTDRNTRQHRPALIISKGALGEQDELVWVAMITSAENRSWPGDVPITHLEKAGLPARSTIRTLKIATVERRHADKLGTVDEETRDAVMLVLQRYLFGPSKP